MKSGEVWMFMAPSLFSSERYKTVEKYKKEPDIWQNSAEGLRVCDAAQSGLCCLVTAPKQDTVQDTYIRICIYCVQILRSPRLTD